MSLKWIAIIFCEGCVSAPPIYCWRQKGIICWKKMSLKKKKCRFELQFREDPCGEYGLPEIEKNSSNQIKLKVKHIFFREIVWFFECYKTRSRFLRKNQHFFRQINVFTKEITRVDFTKFFKRNLVLYYFSTLCVLLYP